MSDTNSFILNRFFTKKTFDAIANNNNCSEYNSIIKKYSFDGGFKNNQEVISNIYDYLDSKYRNEYYYKNTLLNKLLIGVHSINTTTALTELPVAKSKADFVLINGKAVVYEIKTDLDNLERLESQINDYYKAFNNVVIVTSENNYNDVLNKYGDSDVGIYVLTKRGSISRKKEPVSNNNNLLKSVMFKTLRKSEFERIILDEYGALPDVSQFIYYKSCKQLFESISTDKAYLYFIRELKLRDNVIKNKFVDVPYELKFLVYFSNYSEHDYDRLFEFLKEEAECTYQY